MKNLNALILLFFRWWLAIDAIITPRYVQLYPRFTDSCQFSNYLLTQRIIIVSNKMMFFQN